MQVRAITCWDVCIIQGLSCKNLENILVMEGLIGTKGLFTETPFSCLAITRDYSCLPHDDPTNYGFEIIVSVHLSKFIFYMLLFFFKIYYIVDIQLFFLWLKIGWIYNFFLFLCRWKSRIGGPSILWAT